MSIIPTTIGNPQASDIAVETVLPMTGNASRQDLQSTLGQNDAEVAKLYEDRNVQLTQGGSITYNGSGTALTFTENLNLEINSQVAGGSPTVIPLFTGSPPFTANIPSTGNMVYAVINRSLGTATLTDSATSLPAVNSSNQEVFLIGKRNDAGDGTKRFYFRDGTGINAGQTIRLGAPAGFTPQFLWSSQVTTSSGNISSSSFTTFDNSPAFTINATVTGTYKVYCSIPLESVGTGTQLGVRIFNTFGGATLLAESQALNQNATNGTVQTSFVQSVFALTIGNSYVFDIQGKTGGSGSVNNQGSISPFYIFAELMS